MTDHDDLAALSLSELLDRSRALAGELASRVSDPGLLDAVTRFPADPVAERVDRSAQWGLYAHADAPADDVHETSGEGTVGRGVADHDAPEEPRVPVGSLPVVQLQVEELARWVDASRTALAGHVDRVFGDHPARREVLGIPEGKCAYRNAAEYLREHLRIRRVEAGRRIRRAGPVMARRSLDGTRDEPPILAVLAGAVGRAQLDACAVDLVADTLSSARRDAARAGVAAEAVVDGLIADGERSLVAAAQDADPDTLGKVCAYWCQRFDALADPDGLEPTEAQTRAVQGLFYHGRGAASLHRWSLLATDAQHEVLKTIASAASNPRTANPGSGTGPAGTPVGSRAGGGQASGTRPGAGGNGGNGDDGDDGGEHEGPVGGSASVGDPSGRGDGSWADVPGVAEDDDARNGFTGSWAGHLRDADALDARSRAQRELDGLVSALTGALALTGPGTGTMDGEGSNGDALPDIGGGGARPQVMVVIDYETLRGQYGGSKPPDRAGPPNLTGPPNLAGPAGSVGSTTGGTGHLVSQAAYTGPVGPQTIRRLACEAELVPVVLGGRGEVLDVGRSQRLFPRKLRRALVARDRGCAAPACPIPAPWCEAHHIEHWEHGGPTSVDNGVLLCSHHHHAVHTGAWDIQVRDGIPWFIPARYHDPDQRPRRNHYWHPGHPGTPDGPDRKGTGINDRPGDPDNPDDLDDLDNPDDLDDDAA